MSTSASSFVNPHFTSEFNLLAVSKYNERLYNFGLLSVCVTNPFPTIHQLS